MEQTRQQVTIKDLLESGAHFGHQRHRWNPKMKCYIYKELNGIYIIDLSKTIQQLRSAIQIIESYVAKGEGVLFVGTKKQAKEVVKECAEESGEYYVCERWLGGMLTNLTTVKRSVKKLEHIEKELAKGGEGLTKKEFAKLAKEHEKLDKNLSGIRTMKKIPGLVVVVDPSREHIAVAEARKLGIPVMALVDTNCDPDPIDHVIACNDDALKSIKLILSSLTRSIVAKKKELNLSLKKDDGNQKIASKKEEKPIVKADEKASVSNKAPAKKSVARANKEAKEAEKE